MKRFAFLATALLLLGGSGSARADVIFGSSVNVTVNDDPNGGSFSGTVAVSSTPTLFDGGLLQLKTTITPVNSLDSWIQFDVSTPNGTPIAGNPNASWGITISNIQTNLPTALAAFFTYWSQGGVPYSNISQFGSYPPVEPDPLNPSISVYGESIPPPYTFTTTQTLFAQVSPYSFIESGGNSVQADGWSIAGQYSAVPVPAALSLAGLGIAGLGALAWWRRRHLAIA
jgi:hypothetical protein